MFFAFLGRIWWTITMANFSARNMLKYFMLGRSRAGNLRKMVIFHGILALFPLYVVCSDVSGHKLADYYYQDQLISPK
jgi:hypothetical protein